MKIEEVRGQARDCASQDGAVDDETPGDYTGEHMDEDDEASEADEDEDEMQATDGTNEEAYMVESIIDCRINAAVRLCSTLLSLPLFIPTYSNYAIWISSLTNNFFPQGRAFLESKMARIRQSF